MSGISLVGVTKRFGDVVAVEDLTLDVGEGELLVLLGPSGCGKSTVLRMIAGLDAPTAGEIRIGGRVVNDVEAKDRDVAMVFQSYALYPHMSVQANIEFPLRARKVPRDERARMAAEVAAMLELTALLDRKPAQLSGGQRQRVALARAVVRRPEAFLMDEPLSNLDAKLRAATRVELVELHRRLDATVVYVTHDQVEAMTMGRRVAILDRGVLQQVDPPQEVYDRPANLFVAGFVGTPPMNAVVGRVETADAGVLVRIGRGTVVLAPEAAAAVRARADVDVVVGVRPEHARVVAPAANGAIDATVEVVEHLGHEQHVVCRLPGGHTVTVRQGSHHRAPSVGSAVGLVVEPRYVHCFDAASGVRIGP